MIYRLIIFLVLNFASIGLGSVLAGKGPRSEWYANLTKAPWTPPGWAFGVSWTLIMICFSIYLAYLWPIVENRKLLIGVLIVHYILILSWNPIFFYYHQVLAGLFVISGLTLVIGFFLFYYWSEVGYKSLLVTPYLIWLIIATSLNA
ncbi:tryptophan-rich sensory protein [Aequorivita sp. H23M31]|uniref:Tryptophan-rich sensory protein n=1 Tax=Aequorivita ciconiae TaxID=2494375 RepID=A0A410G0G5_9FLAO|nr:TspO/MBR family protein [Aequorivita sp. H23M31]QAA80739.1 tryptophan-rich sensory protein [Aequorivita sp. H23M31]